MNSLLITGGCGFIGTSLIASLSRQHPDIDIRILDNFSTGSPEDLRSVTNYSVSIPDDCTSKKGIVLIEGDIRNEKTAMQCANGIDCIIHLAANTGVAPSVDNPRLDMECNVIGTLNMLEAARHNKAKKFIFASSGAPAGEVEPPIHEEVPAHPVSPYGASKLAGEGYCSAYYRTYGIETVCLRFGNVYGPRSKKKTSVVAKFIRQAIEGKPCVIYGDGNQTRDFLFIDDLIKAIILCLQNNVAGETFQIATGSERTVGEVSQLILKTLQRHAINMNIVYDSPRIGDVMRNYSDTRKAKRMLGWQTEITLEAGIDKTVSYFLG
jgi:UDP-glucose 4-epimerase